MSQIEAFRHAQISKKLSKCSQIYETEIVVEDMRLKEIIILIPIWKDVLFPILWKETLLPMAQLLLHSAYKNGNSNGKENRIRLLKGQQY